MSWTCGIIGLPNAGKTIIFTALTYDSAGRLHSEGRDYLVQDGDILLFRFQR
jgi:ribosome-binding ATPase YchF (GTP1/OBG family)